MSFFYDLNKKLDGIRATPEVTHQQLNERAMSRAAKGYEKYGKEGMEALAKAGREGKALDPVRAKYDKYDNTEVDEGAHSQDAMKLNPDFNKIGRKPGVMDRVAQGVKKVADFVAPGDEDLMRDLERKSGGRRPTKEAAPMSAKQKSFAALAPPKDKITFADKIAGAKKEVDEMLGDVAAEAMKKALGGGKGRNAEMDEASQDNAFTAHKRARVEQPKVGTITHGSKHDVEEIPGGRRVTRRTDAQGISVGADDDKPADGEKRGRGRPKGPAKAPERVTGGATKHKGGRKTNEGSDYGQAQQIYDDLADVRAVAKQAQRGGEFPQGFASRLESVLYAAMTLIKNQQSGGAQVSEQDLDEKAVSKKQQKFMGMVHAAQKGDKPASGAVAKVAKDMGKKDAKDFAATKHKGLPEKKKPEAKKKEVEETSDNAPSKSSGGFKFGGGIYDSINRDLENMISESMSRLDESMSINMSMNNDEHGGPTRSLTVTATDDDAMKLSQLLKSAGLGGGDEGYGGSGYKSACGCGTPDCSCGEQQMDEVSMNQPDYPTNTETAQDNFEYSGGLNKPKSTGQTTVPVIASQDERQESYAAEEEDAIKRMMEMAGMSAAGGASAGDYIDYVSASGEQPPEDLIMQNGVEYDPDTNVISVRNATSLANTHRAIAAAGWKKQAAGARPNPAAAGQAMQAGDTAYQLGEQDAIDRMMEMAGVKKKAVDEEKTDEGNLFTKGLADDNVKVGDKIPGTNAVKKKDIDESIFAMTANLWKSYKG